MLDHNLEQEFHFKDVKIEMENDCDLIKNN